MQPGERRTIRIPVTRRYTHGEVELPLHVVHGRRPGPRLFVSGAIHGDEINGSEIIRRLLRRPILRRLRGTLLAVPVVNVYGFLAHSRYLPDRRDLNRSFPGSPRGSLAARLAHTFMSEVVEHASHGLDLHTGSLHRANLPQVRAGLDDPEALRLARAFGAPVILDSALRDGSLRAAVQELGVPVLVYEAGEALRFDELAIRVGLRGVVAVMRELGMLAASEKGRGRARAEPFVARSSTWVRAPESGILQTSVSLGASVARGQRIGVLSDPLGDDVSEVTSPIDGIVIGRTNLPLANEGDALFHIASFKRIESVAEQVAALQEELSPPFDDS